MEHRSTGEAASLYITVHKNAAKRVKRGEASSLWPPWESLASPCLQTPPASRIFLSKEGKRSLKLQYDCYKAGEDTYDSTAHIVITRIFGIPEIDWWRHLCQRPCCDLVFIVAALHRRGSKKTRDLAFKEIPKFLTVCLVNSAPPCCHSWPPLTCSFCQFV